MDYSSMDIDESNVSESAFWHSNMDLYYGYQQGEIVEVEHESNKYWLASIEYSYKHLILLKWIGNYGEFWVDTSAGSSSVYNEQASSKRLFPPGHHLQSQLKSQFTLERPTKILEKPSFYNPENDPYAEIKTVDDLLAHEADESGTDAFGKSSAGGEEPALQLVKMTKTNLTGHDDLAELLAAIESLNPEKEADSYGSLSHGDRNVQGTEIDTKEENSSKESELQTNIGTSEKPTDAKNKPSNDTASDKKELNTHNHPDDQKIKINHETFRDICKKVQDSAMSKGRYLGLDDNLEKVFNLKPKQYFDLGGANHERVLVPGTLVEVCHTIESDSKLELCHWFATVVKNVGGRLTLRWFLTDEPKFKQGRLELKSCRSALIREEEESDGSDDNKNGDKRDTTVKMKLPVKDITFCMHFCNPSIYTVSYAKSAQRIYKMPSRLFSFIEETNCHDEALMIETVQKEYIFDMRRMNLDKDRPIIDHLLSTARFMMPQYVNLSFAPNDKNTKREILLSTSKTTKLLRGFVKREMETGVYEIHSEPLGDSGEVVKFIYPYDSTFSILPTSWAINNEDCLSIHPSRNPTPTPTDKSSVSNSDGNSSIESDKAEPIHAKNELIEQEPSKGVQEPGSQESLSENQPVSRNACDTNQGSEATSSKSIEPYDVTEEDSALCQSHLKNEHELDSAEFKCTIDESRMSEILSKFRVMDQLEVVHPSSDVTICLGRIRKIVYPLLWIQISSDSYTLLPFNSTDIYPVKWCEINNHPLISLLPPRKRLNQSSSQQSDNTKRRKKTKGDDDDNMNIVNSTDQPVVYEKEHFDLGALSDKQLDIDYILNEKSMYIRIFFNHKCFTGPSLSKGKICSLPQYVGPGPLRLVMDEVVTKVISVAYVPPRILNDLSSKAFEELLIARNMTNTTPMEFKAKYQKRVHREDIPVCINPDDVALYCECICEHLKCCYNLFGPVLYDGDDCPGHCRALTKSNKFMKRATYYREKARLGEFTSENGISKKSSQSNSASKTSRPRYAGRDSSESTSSSISRSEQLNSRASSAGDDVPTNEMKENLVAVEEMENEDDDAKNRSDRENIETDKIAADATVAVAKILEKPEADKITQQPDTAEYNSNQNILTRKAPIKWPNDSEFDMIDAQKISPNSWTVEDVAKHLEWCRLGRFKPHMMLEGIDGVALLLLDRAAIREHFQFQTRSDYSPEEVGKLCRFVEFVKARAETSGLYDK